MRSNQTSGMRQEEASLSIGELARHTGRTVHAIRWYESIGLLPAVQRDRGNRRVFHRLHIDWLDLLDKLRLTGMSTKEMQAYAAMVVQGRKTLAARRDFLKAHRIRVRQTIEQWQDALALLERKVDFYDSWIRTGQRPKEIPGSVGRRWHRRTSTK